MAAAQSARSKPIRVALVDDHQLVLDGLVARLADEAPAVQVVTSSSAWRELIDHPEFPADVVVLDLHLEDSIPIATKIRALYAVGSAVVVISRHADNASINAAVQAGALGFISKSDSAEDLISAIYAASDNRSYLSAPIAAAVAEFARLPDAGLGGQEQRSLMLYASGRSIREVAEIMETTDETVKSYIKRGRRKYRDVGIDIGTRSLLRRHAVREGWLSPE